MSFGFGYGFRLSRRGGGGSQLLPETKAYLAAMNATSKAANMPFAKAYDAYIRKLQEIGVWQNLEYMTILCTPDESGTIQAADACLVNIVDPAMVGTPVNSPYHEKLSGNRGAQNTPFTGGYIKTGYSPNGTTSKMTANNQGLGLYYVTGYGANADLVDIGKMDSLSIGSHIQTEGNSSGMGIRTTSGFSPFTYTTRQGMKSGYRRNDASNQIAVSIKQESGNLASASGSFVQREFFLLCRNNFGSGGAESAALFTFRQSALAYAGASLSAQQHADLVDAFDTLKTALGSVV
jgi:hypothetical protein